MKTYSVDGTVGCCSCNFVVPVKEILEFGAISLDIVSVIMPVLDHAGIINHGRFTFKVGVDKVPVRIDDGEFQMSIPADVFARITK